MRWKQRQFRGIGLCFLGGLSATGLWAQCPSGNPPAVVTVTTAVNTEATNCIQTSGSLTVTGTSPATFEAGSAVYLMPGFRATAGSSGMAFKATIGPVVTTTSLPTGTLGVSYTPTQLSAAEGASGGPFTWLGAGLPSGLTISTNGTISGTPTAVGSYLFGVMATDALGRSSVIRNLSIAVLYETNVTFTTTPSGAQLVISATVSRVNGSGTPTGPINFLELTPDGTSLVRWIWSGTLQSGTAVSPAFTVVNGSDILLVAYNGDSNFSGSSLQRIAQQGTTAQTISFAQPSSVVYSSGLQVGLTATATSSLGVSFASNTASTCTVSGNTATLVAAGSCSITASQAGNATYSAATPVTQVFSIAQATQTITFTTPNTITLGSGAQTLSASATSGLAVSFASGSTSICTVSSAGSPVPTYSATPVAVGTCSITASQPGDENFQAATAVTRTFQVTTLAAQSITFANPGVQISGSTVSASVSASSQLPVTLTSSTTTVCTVSGINLALASGSGGTCTVTANQAGNGTYGPATPVTVSFSVCQTALREYVRLGGTAIAIENSCTQ